MQKCNIHENTFVKEDDESSAYLTRRNSSVTWHRRGFYKTTQSHLLDLYTTSSSPYSNLAAPLIIGGIILVIIGVVIPHRKED